MNKEIFTKINELIANNKIENALEKLLSTIKSLPSFNELKNILIINQGNYKRIEEEKHKGIISYDEYSKRISLIVDSIQFVLDNLEKEREIESLKKFPLMDRYDSILKELAEELAFNHYSVSFGDKYKIDEKTIIHSIFKEATANKFEKNNHVRRNILLIGAGATFSSCPYMPFGKKLKMYLEEDEKYKDKAPKYMVDNDKFITEKYLYLLNRNLGEKEKRKFREDIQDIFNARYLPTHLYEIVAHLLKHSFIDVVINFNFDELLDECIDREVGRANYIKVISDNDVSSFEEIFIDGRLKTPVYIKIHGTVSSKSSLKFTDDHHRFDMPEDMESFIHRWISGELSSQSKKLKIPVNIISLGFDPERFDFKNSLPKDTLQKGSKWFHFNWRNKPSIEDIDKDIFFGNYKGIKIERWIPLVNWRRESPEKKNEYIPEISDVFYYMWKNHLVNLFKEKYHPRGVARHEIVSDLFYCCFDHGKKDNYNKRAIIENKYDELRDYFRSKRYFFERTVVEVGISLMKNKGIIEPREAAKEKVGHYYTLYSECFNESSKKVKRKSSLKEYERRMYTLHEIFDIFKMDEEYSFSKQLLNLKKFDIKKDEFNRKEDKELLNLSGYKGELKSNDDIEEYFNKPKNLPLIIIHRLLKNINRLEVIERINSRFNNDAKFKEHIIKRLNINLGRINIGFTYEINPVFNDKNLLLFESAGGKNIMHTNLSLSYHFYNTFQNFDNWDILLVISERGKFLMSMLKNLYKDELKSKGGKGKKIYLIACHEAIAEFIGDDNLKDQTPESINTLLEKYKDRLLKNNDLLDGDNLPEINVLLLPYWRHHHHTAMFLRKEDKALKYRNSLIPPNFKSSTHNKKLTVEKSIYYFKQGFSNKINPINFDIYGRITNEKKHIQNDQEFLLKIYYAHFIKAIKFQKTGDCLSIIGTPLFNTLLKDNAPYSFSNFVLALLNDSMDSFIDSV